MLRKNLSVLVRVGTLAFAAGLAVNVFPHGRYSHFIAGFLIGMSLVFLIAGVAGRSRSASK